MNRFDGESRLEQISMYSVVADYISGFKAKYLDLVEVALNESHFIKGDFFEDISYGSNILPMTGLRSISNKTNELYLNLTITAHYKRFYMDSFELFDEAEMLVYKELGNIESYLNLFKRGESDKVLRAIIIIYDEIHHLLELFDRGPDPDPSGGAGTVDVEYLQAA